MVSFFLHPPGSQVWVLVIATTWHMFTSASRLVYQRPSGVHVWVACDSCTWKTPLASFEKSRGISLFPGFHWPKLESLGLSGAQPQWYMYTAQSVNVEEDWSTPTRYCSSILPEIAPRDSVKTKYRRDMGSIVLNCFIMSHLSYQLSSYLTYIEFFRWSLFIINCGSFTHILSGQGLFTSQWGLACEELRIKERSYS
jgi:hypothetical protein